MALTFVLETSVIKRLHHPEIRRGRRTPRARWRSRARIHLDSRWATRRGPRVGSPDRRPGCLHADRDLSRARPASAAGPALLARDSQRGRKIPDLLIAAAAEDVDATVLHYDADFDRIAAVTGQPCQWVVPAGTVE